MRLTTFVAFLSLMAAAGPLHAQDQDAKPPSAATRAVMTAPIEADYADPRDEDFAARGFMGTLADPLIRDDQGRVIRDLDSFNWLATVTPDTVHPSLLRNARLHDRNGLFKVTDGVYQVRGFGISNMTVLVGDTGYVVVDTLLTAEAARAAIQLVYDRLGRKPLRAVVYTHSHPDHYGGVRGLLTDEDVASGRVAVIAPDRFMEETVSESVMAGPAMSRRTAYHAGMALKPAATGTVGIGVGIGVTKGAITLIPPTDLIRRTGEARTIDGVTLEFQMTPESEAPSEMNVFLPARRALLVAEIASCSLHNVQTLRGAKPRDAARWAGYLNEAIRLYGDRSDVVLTSHCWPRFGQGEVVDFLTHQRDTYKFIHDQSVRLMNQGLTPDEIAEQVRLPASLSREWYDRGYYGTVRHNVRAVYDRYLGWYDGVPAHLNPWPKVERARRLVALAGGAGKTLEAGRAAAADGDYRWAAELLQDLVFADPGNQAAKAALADAYEQLGYQSESGNWRNIYLAAAKDLRTPASSSFASNTPDVVSAMPTADYLAALATRLDPDRIGDAPLRLNLRFTDRDERALLTVSNRVLITEPGLEDPDAGATITGSWAAIRKLFDGTAANPELERIAGIGLTGDRAAVERLRGALDRFTADFNIVTP